MIKLNQARWTIREFEINEVFRMKQKNKKAQISMLLKIILWAFVLTLLLIGLYFLIKRLTG